MRERERERVERDRENIYIERESTERVERERERERETGKTGKIYTILRNLSRKILYFKAKKYGLGLICYQVNL